MILYDAIVMSCNAMMCYVRCHMQITLVFLSDHAIEGLTFGLLCSEAKSTPAPMSVHTAVNACETVPLECARPEMIPGSRTYVID